MMEILPPEKDACMDGTASRCDCCRRPAVIDEDCCGICEECLSPWVGPTSFTLFKFARQK